jgi:hypothetical protein
MGPLQVKPCCQPASPRRLKDESLICKWAVALLLVLYCLTLPPAPVLAQELPLLAPPEIDSPGDQPILQPGERLFQSPLAPPAAGTVTVTATPTLLPTETPTATPSATPTDTPVPTATPTATIAPLQVSPLVAQSGTLLPDDGALLWIGAAALIILAGSAILLVAGRRQNH